MPETQQRSLFGELVSSNYMGATDSVICEGGCDRTCLVKDMQNTPDGLVCSRCFNDLHINCADCGRLLNFDSWGECDSLRVGPDEVDRCVECDHIVFSTCVECGRRTRRDGNDICTDPNGSNAEFCHECWLMRWFQCAGCEEIFERGQGSRTPDNDVCCERCFSTRYFTCSHCADSFSLNEAHGWEGEPFCESCCGHSDTWKVRPWSKNNVTFNNEENVNSPASYDHIGSYRCFGVEIETEECYDWHDVYSTTDWGCVYECSTPGKEFISPILYGDNGLVDIEEFCRIAHSKRWTTDSSCGLHIHIDARDLSSEQCLRVAYAYCKTYNLWKKFVSRSRGSNSMCGSPQYNLTDIRVAEHIEDFVEHRDKFEFVNWRSYLRYGSIEIRLYRGTLAAREICNWIKLHTRFIDKVRDMSFDEIDETFGNSYRTPTTWKGLVKLIDDNDLMDYWRRKANRCGNELAAIWDNEDREDEDCESEDCDEEPEEQGPDNLILAPDIPSCGDPDCAICRRSTSLLEL